MSPASRDPRRRLGRDGERRAECHLHRLGYELVERNFRCSEGEIDLIAREGERWIFCEVKTRNSRAFGHPAEQLRPRQQERVRAAALRYLQQRGLNPHACEMRFDLLTLLPGQGEPELEHFPGAF